MKNRCILLFCLLFSPVCKAQLTYVEDIAFLKDELPQKHANLFFQLNRETFDVALDNLARKTENRSLVDFALTLQQILVKAGDSHTMAAYSQVLDRNKRLPVVLYWFDDGLYILQISSEHEHILGSRLDKIGEHPIAEVIDSLKTLIVQDNDALNKSYIPELIRHPQILSFFGFVNDSDPISFSFTNMNQEIVKERFIVGEPGTKGVLLQTKMTPLCWQNTKTIFWDHYSDDGVYYVQYNACTGKEVAAKSGNEQMADRLPSFNEFTRRIFETVQEKPIKRFIFDMRFNGGGSSAQGTEFVNQLKTNEKLNKKGVLYVIIGRQTFSSAIINAMNFRNETQAVLVGEETGGMPNHYGEVRVFQLPKSGLNIQYSTKYFQYTDENLKTITPDIKIQYNFKDYLNGIDPSMNTILTSD